MHIYTYIRIFILLAYYTYSQYYQLHTTIPYATLTHRTYSTSGTTCNSARVHYAQYFTNFNMVQCLFSSYFNDVLGKLKLAKIGSNRDLIIL